jgi:hypothetical protein
VLKSCIVSKQHQQHTQSHRKIDQATDAHSPSPVAEPLPPPLTPVPASLAFVHVPVKYPDIDALSELRGRLTQPRKSKPYGTSQI